MLSNDIQTVINSNISLGFCTSNVSIDYFLEKIEQEKPQKSMEYIPQKEEIEVSVWKLIKDFPINVTECKTSNGETYIIQGLKDLMNIKEWITTNMEIDICGRKVKFSDFDEESQDFLKKRKVCSMFITSSRRDEEEYKKMDAYELTAAFSKMLQ